jgi:hypothetical protein
MALLSLKGLNMFGGIKTSRVEEGGYYFEKEARDSMHGINFSPHP